MLLFDDVLYVEYDFSQVGLELDDTAQALIESVLGIEDHAVRDAHHLRRDARLGARVDVKPDPSHVRGGESPDQAEDVLETEPARGRRRAAPGTG